MISMSRAWDKEKIWVPDRIRTYDQPNTGRALYSLELRRTHGELGHILFYIYLTCILHTARISNVDVAMCGERIKDGKFYGRWNKCENEMISMSRSWKRKNLSPVRIRTYDLPNIGRALYSLELRRSWRARPIILGSSAGLRSSSG